MDHPSVGRVMWMALDPLEGIGQVELNLERRRLDVVHADGFAVAVLGRLEPLRLGVQVVASRPAEPGRSGLAPAADAAREARLLWSPVRLNSGMFLQELGPGLWGPSTVLFVDSTGMRADTIVYGVSLDTVGRRRSGRRRDCPAASRLRPRSWVSARWP